MSILSDFSPSWTDTSAVIWSHLKWHCARQRWRPSVIAMFSLVWVGIVRRSSPRRQTARQDLIFSTQHHSWAWQVDEFPTPPPNLSSKPYICHQRGGIQWTWGPQTDFTLKMFSVEQPMKWEHFICSCFKTAVRCTVSVYCRTLRYSSVLFFL